MSSSALVIMRKGAYSASVSPWDVSFFIGQGWARIVKGKRYRYLKERK